MPMYFDDLPKKRHAKANRSKRYNNQHAANIFHQCPLGWIFGSQMRNCHAIHKANQDENRLHRTIDNISGAEVQI
jgi:hypothetical protein